MGTYYFKVNFLSDFFTIINGDNGDNFGFSTVVGVSSVNVTFLGLLSFLYDGFGVLVATRNFKGVCLGKIHVAQKKKKNL